MVKGLQIDIFISTIMKDKNNFLYLLRKIFSLPLMETKKICINNNYNFLKTIHYLQNNNICSFYLDYKDSNNLKKIKTLTLEDGVLYFIEELYKIEDEKLNIKKFDIKILKKEINYLFNNHHI